MKCLIYNLSCSHCFRRKKCRCENCILFKKQENIKYKDNIQKWHEDNKEYLKQKSKKYRQDNKKVLSEKNRIRRQNNKQYIKEYNKKYKKTEAGKMAVKRYQEKHRNYIRNSSSIKHLKSRFNLTPDQYNEMLVYQCGVCDICNLPETVIDKRFNKVRPLSVDHDHKTGKVRALLCHSCNAGLGFVKENIDTLQNMIEYIKKHKEDKWLERI